MTKQEMICRLAARTDLSEAECLRIFNALCAICTDELCAGGKVPLTGIGAIIARESPARIWQNPQTGEKMHIPSFRRVCFRSSSVLKAVLNRGGNDA